MSVVLGDVIDRTNATVVYACGPMAMLKSVTDIATAHGAVAHVAVEESMACGIGVCMTCVLPITGEDGVTKMVRSCVDGPVFRGDRVRWDAFGDGICRVPADTLGAPPTVIDLKPEENDPSQRNVETPRHRSGKPERKGADASDAQPTDWLMDLP